MISSNAQAAFKDMVVRAVKTSPLVSGSDSYDVVALCEQDALPSERFVILTVSSYAFRLQLLVHFTPDKATREHFARVTRCTAADLDDQAFVDAIRESGNIFCGNLNRDLGQVFPHVGMSTPNILEHQCVPYLGRLGNSYLCRFEVVNPQGPKFFVSLYVHAYFKLDFCYATAEAESTGELEMF